MSDWERSDDEVLATLQDLVAIESVNPGLPGGGRGEVGMVDYLHRFFSDLGLSCETPEVLPGRSNFIATLEGENADKVTVFECHMDTASVEVMSIPPYEPHIRDGLMYGRGSCDTKAGGVAMMHAMKRFVDAGRKPANTVVYAGAVDEEYLMRGADHLAAHLNADAAVIAEPTDLEVIRAHKGVLRFTIAVKGVAAHSSKPYLGVNAISKMARLITCLEEELSPLYEGRDFELLGSPTFSIGIIEGGMQVNFVPDLCRIAVDVRTIPGLTGDEFLQEFRDVVERAKAADDGLEAEVEATTHACAPLGTTADARLVQRAAAACDEVVGSAVVSGVPYGTDASFFAGSGVPSIVLGPGSIDQAHGAVEWVECAQVPKAVDIYHRIMEAGV